MQTGEGKTFACAPAAYLHGLTGRGVHIATPNAYLAQRDYEWLSPAFRALGVQVGLLADQASAEAKHAAYLCDVTYGTGYEFGFDYLRDQLARRQRVGRRWARRSGRRSAARTRRTGATHFSGRCTMRSSTKSTTCCWTMRVHRW